MAKEEEKKILLGKIKDPLLINPELAYFIQYFWNDRNKIFEEIFNILFKNGKDIIEEEVQHEFEDEPEEGNEENEKEEENSKELNDILNQIKDYDKTILQVFNEPNNKNIDDMKVNLNNELKEITNEEEIKDDESQSSIFLKNKKDIFIENSKNTIYTNYLNNYVQEKKKLSFENFSLVSNEYYEVFLQINEIKVLRLDYLEKIKIKKDKKEWVCNSYYALFLLYYVKKCKKPIPIYKDDNLEIKTITSQEDFDYAIADGVNTFDDNDYTINIDKITEDVKKIFSVDLLKKSEYKEFLNINMSGNRKRVDFLLPLMTNRFQEEYTYVFGDNNILDNCSIIYSLLNIYYQKGYRFIYIDFDLIKKINTRSALRKYFAFWLPRAFLITDYNQFKLFFKEIINLIDFKNIVYIIRELIKYTKKIYSSHCNEKLYIILNNVNKNEHKIINEIKDTFEEDNSRDFIIICDIEKKNNFNMFLNLYKEEFIKIILLTTEKKSDNKITDISDISNKIKELFSNENHLANLCDLIKLFNFSSFIKYKSKPKEINISDINFLEKYMPFINLFAENHLSKNKPYIKEIKFKNNKIENEFLKQYKAYTLHHIESQTILKEILNLNDGVFFESLIIFDILTEKIALNNNWKNFERVKVKSLFGMVLDEAFDFEKYKGKNIIFTQESKTGEIFDFGLLIYKDNKLIMKLYQVSTNKSEDDFKKLDLDIIKLHLINIKKQLKNLGEIKEFSFGIITSYSSYDKYSKDKSKPSEYKLMKEKCNENNYELLIYNIDDKQFYIEKENEINKDIVLFPFDIFCIEKNNIIELPNYDSIFELNPRLLSMKYINKDYNKCIANYFGNTLDNEFKIIGKINYEQKFLNIHLNNSNVGILISGTSELKEEKETSIKRIKKEGKNRDIKIIIEKDSTKIYEKEYTLQDIKEISDNFSKYKKLSNPHVILFKYNENNYLRKKRKGESLFQEKIISSKSKKKENDSDDFEKLKLSLAKNALNKI